MIYEAPLNSLFNLHHKLGARGLDCRHTERYNVFNWLLKILDLQDRIFDLQDRIDIPLCILKSWSSELQSISKSYKLGEARALQVSQIFCLIFRIKIITTKCDILNLTVIFWWCTLPWNRWNRDSKLGSLLVSSMIPPIWASVIWVSCHKKQRVLIKPTLIKEIKDLFVQ